jgi:hypothetical protein
LEFLEDFIKRTATIGAKVDVVHHSDYSFGQLEKRGRQLFALSSNAFHQQYRSNLVNLPNSYVLRPSE